MVFDHIEFDDFTFSILVSFTIDLFFDFGVSEGSSRGNLLILFWFYTCFMKTYLGAFGGPSRVFENLVM